MANFNFRHSAASSLLLLLLLLLLRSSQAALMMSAKTTSMPTSGLPSAATIVGKPLPSRCFRLTWKKNKCFTV